MVGALATMLASGCTKQELIQKFAPAQDQAMAKQYMDDLREGAIDKIEAHVDASMQSPTLPATLQRKAAARSASGAGFGEVGGRTKHAR